MRLIDEIKIIHKFFNKFLKITLNYQYQSFDEYLTLLCIDFISFLDHILYLYYLP